MRVEQFEGLRNSVPPPGIRPVDFAGDEGSDRYRFGSWRRRRGIAHANVDKLPGPITAIISWDLPGIEFATLVVSGTEVHGFLNA